jgi:hypothetical protein
MDSNTRTTVAQTCSRCTGGEILVAARTPVAKLTSNVESQRIQLHPSFTPGAKRLGRAILNAKLETP